MASEAAPAAEEVNLARAPMASSPLPEQPTYSSYAMGQQQQADWRLFPPAQYYPAEEEGYPRYYPAYMPPGPVDSSYYRSMGGGYAGYAGGSASFAPEREAKKRVGHWTREEEAYATKVAELFAAGRIPNCPEGTTLRSLLVNLLNCTPMRVSKKFSGEKGVGKRAYKHTHGSLDKEVAELMPLEEAFHRSLGGTARLKLSLLGTSNLGTPLSNKQALLSKRGSKQRDETDRYDEPYPPPGSYPPPQPPYPGPNHPAVAGPHNDYYHQHFYYRPYYHARPPLQQPHTSALPSFHHVRPPPAVVGGPGDELLVPHHAPAAASPAPPPLFGAAP